ncbi:uncharacterized protein HMPREF1541_09896 [Cyphellophora europaea CBS 101466]|uniref:Uncharacterized protein n=1 Tax=Cyphellophora europaea (strain CBS 101466) TaxID=1220924 RepID=W2S8R1_CYPE1|nr:uncharacterized protein HMPREF1541_09896 [Cyphellophora europaea CBS 101466]ETN45020.1 hypothetical protein HMPREF1541_09896 [Cyphellophora europaea CBS 101466]
MSTAKPYDPIKSIEGMYHGTVTRIAYALKDPGNFGQSTKGIIQECSKQFQDALDDCEIQILDAKWYLEHQLRLRKQKRAEEAKAREEQAASAKRKHDQVEADGQKDQGTKRQKVEQLPKPEPEPEKKPTPVLEQPSETEPTPAPAQQPADAGKPAEPTPTEKPKELQQSPAQEKADTAPDKPPDTVDDLFGSGRPTPTAEPGTAAGTLDGVDDFNQFESMFGEATGDDTNINPDGDLGFDLQMGDDDFAANIDTNPDAQTQPAGDSGLDSLLPGLESYANQNQNNTGGDSAQNAATAGDVDFNLPELGGPNEFDAFLDANNFDSLDMGNDANLDGDINNMDAPLDFDSMFS